MGLLKGKGVLFRENLKRWNSVSLPLTSKRVAALFCGPKKEGSLVRSVASECNEAFT